MLPFIAAGLGIIAASSLVAWHYNEKTKEELFKQKKYYKDRENLKQKYAQATSSMSKEYNSRQQELARMWHDSLLSAIAANRRKIIAIKRGYDQIYPIIQAEVQSESTSPYRRSALKREFAQIDDGRARIEEYGFYLDYEKQQVDSIWESQQYSSLFDLQASDALLPLEWLYAGKLLIVGLDEVGGRLDRFGHRLNFDGKGGDVESQKVLAVSYGDEFPILIKNKGKKDNFYGCVARGIAFHDFIMPNNQIEATIEHFFAKEQSYLCSFYDGKIKAYLPQNSLINPAVKLLSGQRVPVFFDNYDSTLSYNPTKSESQQGNKKYRPYLTVSEKKLPEPGMDTGSLYLIIDSVKLDHILESDDFYSNNTYWTLGAYSVDTDEVIFYKGKYKVVAGLSASKDGFYVKEIISQIVQELGVDMPFDLILATSDYAQIMSDVYGWCFGVEQLLVLASQMTLNPEQIVARSQGLEFFKQWQQVLQYQKQYESIRSLEFVLTPMKVENKNTHLMIINHTDYEELDDTETVFTLLKKVQKDASLTLERVSILEAWHAERGEYVPVIERRNFNKTEISFEASKLTISAQLNHYSSYFNFNENTRFRLIISLPNAPLYRQEQALISLFEDRMVEPSLKDVFLSPKDYKAGVFSRVSKKINWHNKLTNSQKNAIEKTLSSQYIMLIQGPPGTGKTTTIVELMYQLLMDNPNQRILIASQQNTAVDNALAKFKTLHGELLSDSMEIVRIGNPDRMDDDIANYHFDKHYEKFLSDKLKDAESQLQLDLGNIPVLIWRSLLLKAKESLGTSASDEFFSAMLTHKHIVGATCVGLAARKVGVDNLDFDIAIIDEAGRATVPELLIPILRSKKVVLIGDHHQLPPCIAPILREDETKEELAFLEESFLETSFFEKLFNSLPKECTATLNEQFRMAKPIGDLVADLFYTINGERQLENGIKGPVDTSNFTLKNSLIWVDIKGRQKRKKNSMSSFNEQEANAIVSYLNKISEIGTRKIDVAVITPYSAQKKQIRELLKAQGQQIELGRLTIKVDTIDSFQGSEAELVVYSTVRTQGSLKFLLDKKRLNVACSRAKENLIFFGNIDFLKNANNVERNLFQEIINRADKMSLAEIMELSSR